MTLIIKAGWQNRKYSSRKHLSGKWVYIWIASCFFFRFFCVQFSLVFNLNLWFFLIVTRKMARILKDNKITREVTIRLDRNFRIESIAYLNNPPVSVPRRRVTISGTNLYAVNQKICETGFDHLRKIPRSNVVNVGASTSGVNVGASTSGANGANRVQPFAVRARVFQGKYLFHLSFFFH